MASKKPTTTTQPTKMRITKSLKPDSDPQISWCRINNIVDTYKNIAESRIFEDEPESMSVHKWFKSQLLSEFVGINDDTLVSNEDP